jgi:hypothetical protein
VHGSGSGTVGTEGHVHSLGDDCGSSAMGIVNSGFMSNGKPDSASDDQGFEHPFIQEIVSSYADVFSEKLQGLPPKRKLFHTIPMTVGHVPPARAAYRLAPPEYKEAYKQVHDLLEQGLVRPSCSPYSSPVLFVTKKDGSYRMVIDYRAVNRLTNS